MSQPDRSKLPIRGEPFQGVANRTLEGSQPDWDAIGHVNAPDGAPNVLLVLIDDAGFGNPATFGGPIDTPNYTRMAEGGLRYNRFHVTALCSPTRAALLTGRNNHAVGFGSVGEFSTAFPGYTGFLPDDCIPFPRILRDNGYSTVGVREVASDAGQPAGTRRAVRPLAGRVGLRLLLRVPRRWLGAVGPVSGGEPEDHRHAQRPSTTTSRRTTCPTTWRTRRSSGSTRSVHRTPGSRSSPTSPPDAAMPRTTWQRPGPRSTRAPSTRAGTRCARRRSPGRRSSASSPPRRSSRRATTPSPHGTTSRTSSRPSTPARWRCTRAIRRTPTTTSAVYWTRSTSSVSWTTRW